MDEASRQPKIGPYKIEAPLGYGGAGEVYLALDERLGRRVALKRLRPARTPEDGSAADSRTALLHEARAAARLNHPNLIQIHDVVSCDGADWIVMEWADGVALSSVVDSAALPAARFLPLAREITDGLAAVHDAGLVHRDLKSENVVMTTSGGVKILDFGLAETARRGLAETARRGLAETARRGLAESARRGPAESPRRGGPPTLRGTPRAMSPEQVLGQSIDQSSDLFSLGVLFYELLTARSPFLAGERSATLARICHEPHVPLLEHDPAIPEAISQLIDRLLDKDPRRRPSSAQEVLAVLDAMAVEPSEAVGGAARAVADRPSSPEVAGPPPFSLAGERRRICVLCCDLTAVLEPADGVASAEMLDALPSLQKLAVELIERHGGRLLEVLGHRLVACFGLSRGLEVAAWCAVRSALELSRLGDQVAWAGDAPPRPRSGVHTGGVVVLAKTPDSGRPRIILGETLDAAVALLDRADPGEVLTSPASDALVTGLFRTDGGDFDPGAAPPARRVLGSTSTFRCRPVAHAAGPMIGRSRELGALLELRDRAAAGQGRCVALAGEAGLGKTRLVAELRQLSAGPWLEAHGCPQGRYAPLAPFGALLCQWAGVGQDESRQRRLESFEAALRELGLPVGEFLPPLSCLLAAEADLPDLSISRVREIQDLLLDLFVELAERRFLTLVFEDVQWMGAEVLEWLGRLAEAIDSLPLLLVVTHRPEESFDWPGSVQTSRLNLAPLAPDEMAALLAATEGEVRDLGASGGVPGIALALSSGRPGGRVLDAPETPDGLWFVLASRLDGLEAEKNVVICAAVIEGDLTESELAERLAEDRALVARQVEDLVRGGLFERPPGKLGLRFRIPAMRQVARSLLLPEDARRLGGRGTPAAGPGPPAPRRANGPNSRQKTRS